jgi:FkbM family methyltransferase
LIKRIKNKLRNIVSKNTSKINCGVKSFTLGVSNSHEEMRADTFYSKEPEMIEWIDSFTNDSVFYDLGANIGIYSLYAATIHNNIKVYSFEPESQNFAKLCMNIFNNKLSNMKPYQIGISDKTMFTNLNIAVMEAGAGAATLEGEYLDSQKTIFEQGIFSSTLDDLVLKNNFPIPKYIKIDVDGLEEQILHGSKEVLSSESCQELLVEFNYIDKSDNDVIFSYLKDLGFSLIKESDWTETFNNQKSKNFIFKK